MKRLYASLTALTIFLCAFAQAKLGFADEENSYVGIYVKDLKTGEVIAQNDAHKGMVPASVMKTVTTAAAISLLGEDYRFTTPVYLYGSRSKRDKSVWEGNLVIESCGDPTINSKQFKEKESLESEIIRGMRKSGIKKITGKIIIKEPMLQQGCIPEWEIEDVAWSYGAGLYSFNFNDNDFELTPATKATEPFIPDLNVTVLQDIDGNDLVRGIFSNDLIVYSREPRNRKVKMNTSMNNPAEVFKALLYKELEGDGIKVERNTVDNVATRLLVCEHQSVPMSEIIEQTLVVSHNLFAEGLLRALAADDTRKEALKTSESFLESIGLDTKYAKLIDGSGLARNNRLQPVFIADMLETMLKSRYAKAYVDAFPIVGEEGTVKNLLAKTRLKGQLALKSGSMNGVQCFAGYKLDADGDPTHIVVILVNNFYCPRKELRESIENFLLNTL